ncbi:MAG: cysteine desulfurase family protein [Clostridiales bacterium]|nr:cysteine desulfurase family protein [Clostridiales bacterium]
MRDIYLDNSATTRILPEVRDAMIRMMELDYGNPSSMHRKGMDAEQMIRQAREEIAATLKVDEKEITFTSGGTESNNLALIGTAMANRRAGMHLITTAIEHASVSHTMDYLESQGFEITRLGTDEKGRISLEELEKAIRPDTILVSIMMVNNEIGTIEPVEEIGARIKAINPGVLFHVDAIQAYGKMIIRPRRWKIDLLCVSGHKIHGPKGSGFLYIRDKVKVHPIIFGGEQQKGLRSGTENVPGIVGLAIAARMMYEELESHVEKMYRCREILIQGLEKLPGVTINGAEGTGAAPQVISASFEGIRSEVLLHSLEAEGIYISAGSACSSNKQQHISATLQAIHLDRKLLDCTVRFSLSIFSTEEEMEETLQVLEELLPKLRRYVRK